MLKRLVAAASVSAIALIGLAPTATAATDSSKGVAVVFKVSHSHGFKHSRVIDWDAPPADGGGATTQRIDWD